MEPQGSDEQGPATGGQPPAYRPGARWWVLLVVVIAIIVAVVAVVVLYLMRNKAPKDCQRCRMKPLCSETSQERCETSMDAMLKLDSVMNDVSTEYIKRYGGSQPIYYLKEHPQRSYSYMKRSVYLVLRREDGTLYDNNTLTYVGVHELGHLLCGTMDGKEHGPHWTLVFTRLLGIAVERGHYDPETPVDSSYPSE